MFLNRAIYNRRLFLVLGWIIVCLVGAYLRIGNLELNPIHADEATGAHILGKSLEKAPYDFNPKHFHGPMLRIVTAPIARMRGENSWEELTKISLRISPVIAGILLIITPLFFTHQLGRFGSLISASFISSSPLLVYYNRIYIHESLLTLFGLLALASIIKLHRKSSAINGVVTGILIGLMLATKVTVSISIFAWALSFICFFFVPQLSYKKLLRNYLKPLSFVIMSSIFISIVVYTNGLQYFSGFLDACLTFFLYEPTAGHEKVWYYYVYKLIWPKQALGIWWTEASIVIVVITTLVLSSLYKCVNKHTIFIIIAAAIHIVMYSLIAYKTPWLMMLPWAHLCLVTGSIDQVFANSKTLIRVGIYLLIMASFCYQTKQSLHAVSQLSNHSSNPYAYVPTTRDGQNISNWLEQITATSNSSSNHLVAVIGSDYWPLPWYLRNLNSVSYWTEITATTENYPIIFSMPSSINKCDSLLLNTHIKLPRSLRSNVPIILYLRNDYWEHWISSQPK